MYTTACRSYKSDKKHTHTRARAPGKTYILYICTLTRCAYKCTRRAVLQRICAYTQNARGIHDDKKNTHTPTNTIYIRNSKDSKRRIKITRTVERERASSRKNKTTIKAYKILKQTRQSVRARNAFANLIEKLWGCVWRVSQTVR